jgi:hypothetical protein
MNSLIDQTLIDAQGIVVTRHKGIDETTQLRNKNAKLLTDLDRDVGDLDELIEKYQEKLRDADSDDKKKRADIMIKNLISLKKKIIGNDPDIVKPATVSTPDPSNAGIAPATS